METLSLSAQSDSLFAQASDTSDWGNLGLAAIPLVVLLAVVAYVYRTARRRRTV